MSVEAMTWAFAQPLPPAPKLVLLALANAANREGLCWPGVDTICKAVAPMKSRMVQYHLKWLKDHQLLGSEARYSDRSGVQLSNLYQLNLSTTYRGEGATSCTLEGATSCGVRVQQLLRGEGAIATAPPDKNLEPSGERKVEGEAPTAPACGVTATGLDTKTTGKPRGHRASVFPDGWEVEPWMIELCKGFGLNAHQEFAKFRNLHKAKGSLFVSWPHAFKTWVSRSVEFKQRRGA